MIRFLIISAFLTLFLLAGNSYAQENTSKETAWIKYGQITGIVLDASTNQPLGEANCSLVMVPMGKLTSGCVTGNDGRFELKKVKYGVYDLRITHIGYRTLRITKVIISPEKLQISLDTLLIRPSDITAQTVEITGKKEKIVYEDDRIIFNLDKELQNMGGSAVDVLETVPTVSVDGDGNIRVLGKQRVKIYIDGMEARFLGFDNADALRSFPAADIEIIEVMTNPTAEFNAGGSTGVINIRTKKSIIGSYGGRINTDASTKNRYNTGLGLNYKFREIFTSLNYQNNYSVLKSSGNSLRISSLQDKTAYLQQSDNNSTKSNVNGLRLNSNYMFHKTKYLSASAAFRNSHVNSSGILKSDYSTGAGLPELFQQRNKNNLTERNFLNTALNYYNSKPDNSGRFSANIIYMNNMMNNRNVLDQSSFDFGLSSQAIPLRQEARSSNRNNSISASSVYTKSFPTDAFLIMSYEGFHSILSMKNNYYDYNFPGSYWTESSAMRDDHKYLESKHTFSAGGWMKYKGLRFDPRLRMGFFHTGSKEMISDRSFNNDYLAFLPEIRIIMDSVLPGITIGYRRDVDYPENRQINPYVDYSDSANIFSGNPALKPSFSDDFALYYTLFLGPVMAHADLVYSQRNGIIEQYTYMENLRTSRTTFRNVGSSRSLSASAWATFSLMKSLEINPGITASTIRFQNSVQNKNNFYWSASTYLRFSKGKFSVSGDFSYSSAQITSQEKLKGIFRINLSMRARFLDNKLFLTFKVTDPFNLQKNNSDRYGSGFVYKNYRKEDSRIFTLGVAYSLQKLIEEKEIEPEDIIEYRDDF